MSAVVVAMAGMGLATPLPLSFFLALTTYVPLLIVSLVTYMKQMDFLSSGLQTSNNDEIYDFIVVGGGTAGSVVASRLSKKYRVLLLEAGGDPIPLANIPILFHMLPNQPLIDWEYKSCQTAVNSSGFLEETCQSEPRGKGLGGTSSVNGMLYMRGSPEDFNNWAAHTGDDRWAYSNVERLFRKLEDYDGQWKDNGHHGVGGPMRIEPERYTPSLNYFLEAGKELGFDIIDLNGYQTQGFGPVEMTQMRGTRFSTYRGYIEPALKRENLIIHRFSLATKIRFDVNMRAIGVEYLRHGFPRYAQVAKEIVVSGGTINSPQLLMLSGIGPKEHLTYHKIPVLVDLPVGQNYQNHLGVFGGPFNIDKPVSHLPSRDLNWGAVRDYVENGTGPFSTAFNIIGMAMLSSSLAPKNWPDIAISVLSIGASADLGRAIDKSFEFPNNIFERFYSKNEGREGYIPLVFVGRPKSRGEILLRDSNPLSHPLINPFKKYGDRVEDLQILIEGLNYTLNIFEETATYSKLGSKLASHHLPGCEQFELRSYLYWECLAKLLVFSTFHSSSTCSMGKLGDPIAVVDSQLRVFGTAGLRVADASIMPFVTNANTQAPSIMIGEMCAEMIIQEQHWGTFK